MRVMHAAHKLDAFGDPKSFNASVFRSERAGERASHRDRCDLVMLDLPGGADSHLVHVPQHARGTRHSKLSAVLRYRRHLVQLLDDEAAVPSRVPAASRYLPKLVAWGVHTLDKL